MLRLAEEVPSRVMGPMAGDSPLDAAADLWAFAAGRRFRTILADPPWQFANKTGKIAPEHRRLSRYPTMTLDRIKALPVEAVSAEPAHLYLWVPNALLPDGIGVFRGLGFPIQIQPGLA